MLNVNCSKLHSQRRKVKTSDVLDMVKYGTVCLPHGTLFRTLLESFTVNDVSSSLKVWIWPIGLVTFHIYKRHLHVNAHTVQTEIFVYLIIAKITASTPPIGVWLHNCWVLFSTSLITRNTSYGTCICPMHCMLFPTQLSKQDFAVYGVIDVDSWQSIIENQKLQMTQASYLLPVSQYLTCTRRAIETLTISHWNLWHRADCIDVKMRQTTV